MWYIFNLEFPSYCDKLNICGYTFKRIENYDTEVLKLQHHVNLNNEYQIKVNAGSSVITAIVEEEMESKAIFDWKGGDPSSLDDILLLLSIFSGRDVRKIDRRDYVGNTLVYIAAHKSHYGNLLGLSLPEDMREMGKNTKCTDMRIESGIARVYEEISQTKWVKKYENGYFMFLLKGALLSITLESTFLQCWTIWEHLYTLCNRKKYSDKKICKTSAKDKISFILCKYGIKDEIDNSTRTNIDNLAEIRNRLVHFGRFPDKERVTEDAEFFIRLTEVVFAIILGLEPSKVFNITKKIEEF